MPPNLTLRPAQAGDDAAIRALVRAAQLDPTQLRWPQFWVITQGDRVIACGQLRRFAGAQELGSLVVAPEWRQGGLGARLVVQLIAAATEPLFLECRAPLAAYYARFGFVPVRLGAVPGALRLKFGLSWAVSRLFRTPVAAMQYQGPAPR